MDVNDFHARPIIQADAEPRIIDPQGGFAESLDKFAACDLISPCKTRRGKIRL